MIGDGSETDWLGFKFWERSGEDKSVRLRGAKVKVPVWSV